MGPGRATELVLTGRTVQAEEALATGLGEVELTDEDPNDQALAWTARLAAGPGAVRRTPRLVRENFARTRGEALHAEREAQLACLAGPDTTEAVMAYMKKRDLQFVGE